MSIWLLALTLILLTGFSAVCSSSETAFFSLSTARVHAWRKSGDRRRKLVSKLLAHAQLLLVLIFVLNTFSNVLIQNTASSLFGTLGGGWLLKIGLPFCLILVFGEFLPKYLGLLSGERLALVTAPFFSALEKLLSPLLRLFTSSAEILSRILFFFLQPEPPLTPKQLEAVIETSEAKGILSIDEASLIRNYLEFGRKQARELMTPRAKMPVLRRSDLSSENIIELLKTSKKEVVVLVDEEVDQPIGALGCKEALLLSHEGNIPSEMLSPLFFIPEVMSARRVLQEFADRRIEIACVVDEHGSIAGFIEWEDIKKILLGFTPKKQGLFSTSTKSKQKSISVPGTTPIEIINSFFGSALTSRYHSSTIGGWLAEQFDTIPQVGASFVTEDFAFRVVAADEKMVKEVFIQKRPVPLTRKKETE